MTPFNSYKTGNAVFDDLIQSLSETFRSLAGCITNDKIVTVRLSTVPKRVFHGLGVSPRSIDVVGLNAGVVV